MQEHTKTILVTGAYGHAGSKIVKGLLEKTDFRVLTTGRKADKLESLRKVYPSERLLTQVLDLDNKNNLTLCTQKADMVINAVGPYSMGGFEITRSD